MTMAEPIAKGSAMHGESGYARRDLDAYFTEPRVTEALLKRVKLRGHVWEPACGRGDMTAVLKAHGYVVMQSDIIGRDGVNCWVQDFLTANWWGPLPFSICTNPPYEAAEDFIERALEQTAPSGGMVAMLLRHEYDCAAGRRNLFETPSFAAKYTLTFRPRWDWWERDKPKASPRHNYAWFVWDHAHSGPPTLGWL